MRSTESLSLKSCSHLSMAVFNGAYGECLFE